MRPTKRVQRRLDRLEDGDGLVERPDVYEPADHARGSHQRESLPPLTEDLARIQQGLQSAGVDVPDPVQVHDHILPIFKERVKVRPKHRNGREIHLSSWTNQNRALGFLSVYDEQFLLLLRRYCGQRKHLLAGGEFSSTGRCRTLGLEMPTAFGTPATKPLGHRPFDVGPIKIVVSRRSRIRQEKRIRRQEDVKVSNRPPTVRPISRKMLSVSAR